MKKIVVLVVALMFAASLAYAADCSLCGKLKSGDTVNAYGARLCNGLCNGLLGWSEIFFRPGKVAAAGGNPISGFFGGLGNAIIRTGYGVVEVVTFWTPGESIVKIKDCPLCAYK